MTLTETISNPTNKMNIVKAMLALHKVKRFGKAKSEPAFQVFRRHPVTRGMATYLYMWPLGSLIQQTISSRENYDWWKIARFGLYGALITAPCLYAWVRLSTSLYPNTNLRIACAKVSMTWLETFSAAETWLELHAKFVPTYCMSISILPLMATINFVFIPERRRVLFMSIFSALWTIYLTHAKSIETDARVLEKKTRELEDQK